MSLVTCAAQWPPGNSPGKYTYLVPPPLTPLGLVVSAFFLLGLKPAPVAVHAPLTFPIDGGADERMHA